MSTYQQQTYGVIKEVKFSFILLVYNIVLEKEITGSHDR